MDFDFPLILSWAVIISGVIWLVDTVAFKPRRTGAAEAYRTSAGANADAEAVNQILKEPVLTEYARSFFPVLLLVLVLRSFLFDTRTTDPLTYFGVMTGVLALALAASVVPAIRATRVDPISALRQA